MNIEAKNANFVDASMEQTIYATAIKLWREIVKNNEIKVDTALTILESLQSVQQNSKNRATRIAAGRVTSILVQFMEV